jgi:chemotaxis signal transduction protein
VTEVAAFDRAAVAPPPRLFRGLAAEYLKGIIRRADRLVIFLDVDQLLSSAERIALQRAGEQELAHG